MGAVLLAGCVIFMALSIQTSDGTIAKSDWPKTFTEDFKDQIIFTNASPQVKQAGMELLQDNRVGIQILDPSGREVFSYQEPEQTNTIYSNVELLQLFQAGKLKNGETTAFVGTISNAGTDYIYILYFPVDVSKVTMYVNGEITPPRLVNGGQITDFSGNQVILPDRFTSKYGMKAGDTITLQIGGQPITLEIAEIAAYDTVSLRHTRGATALLPLSTLSELLGQTDGYTEILIEPAEGTTTAELKNELAATLPDGEYKVSEVVNEAQIAADARQKSMPFFLISFFSLTMSVFIIYSSYKVIPLDRLPVIGTFRSIGATQKAVTHILLLESALFGVMGGLIGIPVGTLVLKLILQGMGQSLSQGIEIPVVISPFSIIFSFAVAVVVSLLSAWLPVRRASRLPIKDVVLGNVEEKHIPRRLIVGAGVVLFVISVILPKLASGNMLYLADGFSLLGLIAATILIVPLLTNLISAGLEYLYGTVLGNEGRLAARNMRDNKKFHKISRCCLSVFPL